MRSLSVGIKFGVRGRVVTGRTGRKRSGLWVSWTDERNGVRVGLDIRHYAITPSLGQDATKICLMVSIDTFRTFRTFDLRLVHPQTPQEPVF